MTARSDLLTAARTEALFTSCLSCTGGSTCPDVRCAIRQALRRYGGVSGCAAEVAACFGDSPDTAVRRMRWARSVVADTFPARPTTHRAVRWTRVVAPRQGDDR
jgi:hypothetical protein